LILLWRDFQTQLILLLFDFQTKFILRRFDFQTKYVGHRPTKQLTVYNILGYCRPFGF